jgi:hypothetical protein
MVRADPHVAYVHGWTASDAVRIADDILGDYDVSPDGQLFVMVQNDPIELRPFDLVVVPGWIEEMKARLAAAK